MKKTEEDKKIKTDALKELGMEELCKNGTAYQVGDYDFVIETEIDGFRRFAKVKITAASNKAVWRL